MCTCLRKIRGSIPPFTQYHYFIICRKKEKKSFNVSSLRGVHIELSSCHKVLLRKYVLSVFVISPNSIVHLSILLV